MRKQPAECRDRLRIREVVGAALAVCIAVQWARSGYVFETRAWSAGSFDMGFASGFGELSVEIFVPKRGPPTRAWGPGIYEVTPIVERPPPFPPFFPSRSRSRHLWPVDALRCTTPPSVKYIILQTCRWHWGGFGATTVSAAASAPSAGGAGWNGSVVLPYWFLLSLSSWPWVQRLRRAWRTGLRRRAGHCIRCGYDIRATRERCPECGAVFGAGDSSCAPAPVTAAAEGPAPSLDQRTGRCGPDSGS